MDEYLSTLKKGAYTTDQQKVGNLIDFVTEVIINNPNFKPSNAVNECVALGQFIKVKCPYETVPFNLVQKIVKSMKEEISELENSSKETGEPLDNEIIQETLIEVLMELKIEHEKSEAAVANKGPELIKDGCTVLTSGYNSSLLNLMLKAAKVCKFDVVVAECVIRGNNSKIVDPLLKAKIKVTCVPDYAVYSIMNSVNMVLLGCDTVYPSGIVRTFGSASQITDAALRSKVPVYICTSPYKFTTDEYIPKTALQLYREPTSKEELEEQLLLPYFDYIQPYYITSFITSELAIPPEYVFQHVKRLEEDKTSELLT